MKFSKQDTRYTSDFTKFLNEMKEKNPKIAEGQQAGRLIWWQDRPIDLEARRRDQESRVNQQPYVYQNK